MKKLIVLLMVSICTLSLLAATVPADKNRKYIDKYAGIAVSQMDKYQIPASITLAQGILESGAGLSRLSLKSNNHFGIKCHRNWTGPYVLANDDRPNEKFRKYNTVEESYEDHSVFLVSNSRYASLFRLERTDYKGWAVGLKRAGYATAPNYAMSLINIIERYGLYEYDLMTVNSLRSTQDLVSEGNLKVKTFDDFQVFKTANGLLYIIAENGDDMENIAKAFKIKSKKLYKYNDMFRGYKLSKGDVVYLQEKPKYYKGEYGSHIVSEGESMHYISQFHGVRLETLYKLNKISDEYAPQAGDTIRLCK